MCDIPSDKLKNFRFHGDLELAHIIPRSRAGKAGQRLENVVLLCASCHGAQHNSHYTYNGETWPDLTEWHLMLAKLDEDSLDIDVMAELTGWQKEYLTDEVLGTYYPARILEEQDRWKPYSDERMSSDASSRAYAIGRQSREAEGN